MFVKTAVAVSLLSTAAYALSIGNTRRDNPSDQDLLSSCPGGPGSSDLAKADKCTLTNIQNNADVRVWTVLGDPQLNCAGGTTPVTVTLGGSTTVTQTTDVNANLGISLDGVTIGGGTSTSTATATTESQSIQFTIPPGKQAVYAAGIGHTSQTGNVQVNFGSTQDGHFVWFTGSTVTQLTPKDGDVEFQVVQSDCGADPTDLSSLSTSD